MPELIADYIKVEGSQLTFDLGLGLGLGLIADYIKVEGSQLTFDLG